MKLLLLVSLFSNLNGVSDFSQMVQGKHKVFLAQTALNGDESKKVGKKHS